MLQRPTIIILGASSRDSIELLDVLSPLADVVGNERGLAEGLEAIGRIKPDIVILMIRAGEEEGFLALAKEIPYRAPSTVSIMLSPRKDPDLILSALRSGVREFMCTDEGWEPLRRVIRTLSSNKSSQKLAAVSVSGGMAAVEEPTARGRVVTVFSASGGCGQTTVAVNLAGILSQGGTRPVLLIDLDFHLGTTPVFLDLDVRYTISDVLENQKRLDKQLLMSSLPRHRSGVFLLAPGESLDQLEEVRGENIVELITFLRQFFDFIVVDGTRSFGEHAIASLDIADSILLLVTQDIPTLRNAKRCLDLFNQLAYDPNKTRLVVNRYNKKHRITLEAIEENLRFGVAEVIGYDYETISTAVNRGVLLAEAAPSARVTADLDRLAPLVGGIMPKQVESGGLFSSLFGFGKKKSDSGKKGAESA